MPNNVKGLQELKKGDIIRIKTKDSNTGKDLGYLEYTVENNFENHIEYREGDSEFVYISRHDKLNDWFEATPIEEVVHVTPVVEELSDCGTSVFHIPLGKIIFFLIVFKIVMYILIIRSPWVNRKIVFGKLWVKSMVKRLKKELKNYF